MDDSRPMRRAAAFAIFFIFAIGTAARADTISNVYVEAMRNRRSPFTEARSKWSTLSPRQ
jgi:hypothetical protein